LGRFQFFFGWNAVPQPKEVTYAATKFTEAEAKRSSLSSKRRSIRVIKWAVMRTSTMAEAASYNNT